MSLAAATSGAFPYRVSPLNKQRRSSLDVQRHRPDLLTRTRTAASTDSSQPSLHISDAPQIPRSSSHTSGTPRIPHSSFEFSTTRANASAQYASNQAGKDPFEYRDGRRYLRQDLFSYPLPCDLPELNRQNLQTLLEVEIYGPLSSSRYDETPPKKVLEICCGTALWSALCHDYFASRGHSDVQFVGLDVAPLAPNLRKQGVNWKFVRHDVRFTPLPFGKDEFDLVLVQNVSLVFSRGANFAGLVADLIRCTKPGGVWEIRNSDFLVRSITEHLPAQRRPPVNRNHADQIENLLVPLGYAFEQAQNRSIQEANAWITEACLKLRAEPAASVLYAQIIMQEPDLENLALLRAAVPLGEMCFERRFTFGRDGGGKQKSGASRMYDDQTPRTNQPRLTPKQAALRQTAVHLYLGQLEAMEVMLRDVSGKEYEEWHTWLTAMRSELLDSSKSSLTGECLEISAWWVSKVDK